MCSFSTSTVKLEGNQPHCRSRSLSPSYQPKGSKVRHILSFSYDIQIELDKPYILVAGKNFAEKPLLWPQGVGRGYSMGQTWVCEGSKLPSPRLSPGCQLQVKCSLTLWNILQFFFCFFCIALQHLHTSKWWGMWRHVQWTSNKNWTSLPLWKKQVPYRQPSSYRPWPHLPAPDQVRLAAGHGSRIPPALEDSLGRVEKGGGGGKEGDGSLGR